MLGSVKTAYETDLLRNLSLHMSHVANHPDQWTLLSNDHERIAGRRRQQIKIYSSLLPKLEEIQLQGGR